MRERIFRYRRVAARWVLPAAVSAWLLGGVAAAEARRVVVLYDERVELPGMAAIDASLAETLAESPLAPIELYRESMDLSRFSAPGFRETLRDYLGAKYAGKEIAVAIGVMGPALDFLLANGAEVFPGAALVFCGIDRRELEQRVLPEHATGVLVQRQFGPTLALALRLHPRTERVVFVSGSSDFDARLLADAREELSSFEDRVQLSYTTGLSMEELLAELAALPPRSLVLYSTVFRDADGVPFVPHAVAERVAAAANAPVYGFLDQYVGSGIVGGHVYSLEAHGRAAAEQALQILAGKAPAELPLVESSAGRDVLDWRALQRFEIDAASLPPGALVRFRPAGVWQTHRAAILGAGMFVVLETLLIATLLVQSVRRRRAEAELRTSDERYREVVEAQTELVSRYARDGTLTFANPAYCRYFGRTREQLIGTSLLDLVPASERGEVLRFIEELAEEKRSITCEHRVVAADGSVRWQEWVDYAILAADGSVTEFQGIGRDITQRKEMEESLRRSEAERRTGYERVQLLARRLITAQEEERARIARDLHDDVGQRVASFSITLSRLRRMMPDAEDTATRTLSELQGQAHQLSEDLRHMSRDLHATALQHLGLPAALRARCDEFSRESGVAVLLNVSDDWREVEAPIALCLYRVAQEALRNVAAHAAAGNVTVSLDRRNGHVTMDVADDGRGFDPEHEGHSGLGLISLGERVRMLGGELDLRAAPRAGTRIAVVLPSGETHAT